MSRKVNRASMREQKGEIASDRYILYKNKLKKYMMDKKQEEQGWEGVKHK